MRKIQKLSSTLRELGVFASFYQDTPSLIAHMSKKSCDLVVADYDSFQQVHKLFNIHPKVTSNETLISVYSEKKAFNFSEDFWELSNYKPVSMILGLASLRNQLITSLHWVHVNSETQNQKKSIQDNYKSLKVRFEDHLAKTEKTHLSYEQLRNVSAIVRGVSSQTIRDKESYLIALSKMLEKWSSISKYSFYSLNSSQQKLIPFDFTSAKYKALPQLRMGKACESGIERFAQEMAYQVAFDEMGMTTVALRIEGSEKNPEILCFLSFNQKDFTKVDDQYHWNLFETLLSNLYRKVILQDLEEEVPSQFLPVWDFLSVLDQEGESEEEKYLNIDLSQLNHFIGKKSNRKFYWKTFFNDLLIQLSQVCGSHSKISTFGTMGVLIALPEGELEKSFHSIKDILASFEYWSYFADNKLVIPQYVYPDTYLIPGSSSLFIKKFELLNPGVNLKMNSHETTIRS